MCVKIDGTPLHIEDLSEGERFVLHLLHGADDQFIKCGSKGAASVHMPKHSWLVVHLKTGQAHFENRKTTVFRCH